MDTKARDPVLIHGRIGHPRFALGLLPAGLLLLLIAPTGVSAASATDPRALLYDFEGGVAD